MPPLWWTWRVVFKSRDALDDKVDGKVEISRSSMWRGWWLDSDNVTGGMMLSLLKDIVGA